MRNAIGKIIIIFAFLLIIPINVFADSCDYTTKAELNKFAYKVKAEYEFKTSDDGSTYFDVVIYNIVEDIYINYKSGEESRDSIGTNVAYIDTNSGTYRFSIPIPTNPYKYTFTVMTTKSGCEGVLRTFTLTIPIRNTYHDLDSCKKSGMEDYLYCKEWITEKFSLTDSEVKAKIASKLESIRNSNTDECVGCEETARNEAKIESFEKLKKEIIIGLIIGIVLDFIIMVVQIINIRRNEI